MGGVIRNQEGVSRGVGKRSELAVRRVTSVVKEGVFSMQDQGGVIQSEGGLDNALVESLTNLIAFIFKSGSQPRFAISLWKQYERVVNDLPRTNIAAEGWHNAFNSMVNIAHPTIMLSREAKSKLVNHLLRNGKRNNESMMPSESWFPATAQRINSYI